LSYGKLLVVYDLRNSSVFILFWKVCRNCDAVTDCGRLFQMRAAATGKERSPIELLNLGRTIGFACVMSF